MTGGERVYRSGWRQDGTTWRASGRWFCPAKRGAAGASFVAIPANETIADSASEIDIETLYIFKLLKII
jgi:hypothetical protein